MKRYWQFLIVGVICLLVALLWAQPSRNLVATPQAAVAAPLAQNSTPVTKTAPSTKNPARGSQNKEDEPLPGSSSSLPLLAVIGFGVLAGGITSAMRTR